MSNEEELRNCPFCEGSAKQRQVPGSFGGYGLKEIACQQCDATAPSAQAWNQRTDTDRRAQTIEFRGKTGGKAFTSFICMLRQIDPEIADMFVKAWKEIEEEDEQE